MPRDSNSNTMPICSPNKQECVDKAINIVEQTAFDTSGKFLISFTDMINYQTVH